MSEQKVWFEEMAAALEKERRIALRRNYDACVAEGTFPDSEETWRAFVYGWYGTLEFQQAKREYERAGEGRFWPLFFLVGMTMVALPAVALIFMFDQIDVLRTIGIMLAGGGVLLLGRRSLKRTWQETAEAGAKFRAEWGEPEAESEAG